MGASSFVAVRLGRIIPLLAIAAAACYFLLSCFAAFQAVDVPVPTEWKSQDVVVDLDDNPSETVALTQDPNATPTRRVLTNAEIEALENKGEIMDFEDEEESDVYATLEDDGDWDEEDVGRETGVEDDEEGNEVYDGNDGFDEDGGDDTDWSRFAYIQYVTNEDYLCNSVMIFEQLHRLGSKADRLLMYPKEMLAPDAEYAKTHGGRLLIRARDEYNVTLQPIEIQHRDGQDGILTQNTTYTSVANSSQKHGPIPSPSSSHLTKPSTHAFSPSIQTAWSCNTWMSSSNCPPVPSPCLAPTGSTTRILPRRSSPLRSCSFSPTTSNSSASCKR